MARVLVLAIAGCGFMVHLAATNTILQTIVEERLRGRVMSLLHDGVLRNRSDRESPRRVIADRFGAPLTVRSAGSLHHRWSVVRL
jgi:hypothetical protein